MSFIYHSRGRSDCPRRVFVGLPQGDGKAFASHISSLVHAEAALHEAGWAMDCGIEASNCHVDDTRNSLVREFMGTDCEKFLFIDSDVSWRDEDLVRLVCHDRDIVAGVYPKKTDTPEFPVYLTRGELWAEADGLLEVERAPTGFLCIKRGVLEALEAKAVRYNGNGRKATEHPYALIFERTNTPEDGRRWSGDYSFCNKAKALGYRIFVDPEMHFGHAGTKTWSGCLGDHLRTRAGLDHPRFNAAVDSIRLDGANAENLIDLFTLAGNDYAASPEMLFAAYNFALNAKGPILECGSGLTTLVMGIAAERSGVAVHSLEHELDWVRTMRKRLRGMDRVFLHHAPLEEYWPDFVSYRIPVALESLDYSILVCDGPQRKWGRDGVFRLLERQISGAHWLIDDTDDPNIVAMVKKYGPGRELHPLHPEGGIRAFGVMPAPACLPQASRMFA